MIPVQSADIATTTPTTAPTSTSQSTEATTTTLFETNESEYCKRGLALWLNNRPERAEQHFRARLHDTPIFAGYAFTVSMVGGGAAAMVVRMLELLCINLISVVKFY